ncbi:MAG: hypothetical protein EBV58_05935 [Actinobacteria bacterium]|nr:hypothetical protein [Actinomycetota bacterium]
MITLPKIDIHGENASTAVAIIATVTKASLRFFESSRKVRIATAKKETPKKVNAKPSTPARPVTKTIANETTAEITSDINVATFLRVVACQGIVGCGVTAEVSVTIVLTFAPSNAERLKLQPCSRRVSTRTTQSPPQQVP